MNPQKILFKKPVTILQVFHNINVYGKDKKSFDLRREDSEWKEFHSESGYLKDGELFLPEAIMENSRFPNCDLITIEDSLNREEDQEVNRCFHLHHPNEIYIFQLKQKEELELHLKYDDFAVGIPKRADFKICDLKEKNPVEIKINGKTDFSMTSGRARVFKEQFYIFEVLGKFSSCQILRNPYPPVPKKVPGERKLIDLLKPLW